MHGTPTNVQANDRLTFHQHYVRVFSRHLLTMQHLKWPGYTELIGQIRNAYKILVRGKHIDSMTRHKWENNIYIECEGNNWINLVQDSNQLLDLTNTIINCLVSRHFLTC